MYRLKFPQKFPQYSHTFRGYVLYDPSEHLLTSLLFYTVAFSNQYFTFNYGSIL